MKRKLLITGCSGLIGQILWRNLEDTFELYGLDQRVHDSADNLFEADIASATQVDAVFGRIPSGVMVVHLAGNPSVDADWDSAFRVNIGGTQNVFAAAQRHRVKRLVFASSNHTTGAYEGIPPSLHLREHPPMIRTTDPIRPDGFYGVSKVAGEALARMYFDLYGLQSICLRIGSVLKDDDPSRDARFQAMWLSHRDLVQLVRLSLLAEVGFGIYYGVSDNAKRFVDISNAERELGYHPQDGFRPQA
jgi:NAD+ dependent glucose-6-phosphate dehydrogenase